MRLDIPTTPSRDDLRVVRQGLSAYNVAQVPQLTHNPEHEFNVAIHEDGRVVAGANCELNWGYVYFDSVWTDDSVRGKGYGTLIMNAAETYALQQGVTRAFLLTTTF